MSSAIETVKVNGTLVINTSFTNEVLTLSQKVHFCILLKSRCKVYFENWLFLNILKIFS
jgi:hypothetical protein